MAIYLAVQSHWVAAVIILLLTAVIFTTFYVTEISLEESRYVDFISIAGLPVAKESTTFRRLERIIITKETNVRQMNSRIQSHTMRWSQYTGVLIFDNGKALDLVSRTDKRQLVEGVKDFARFLQVPVEDRTTPQHHWIFFPNETLGNSR